MISPSFTQTQPQPPGPGLGSHEPSVKTPVLGPSLWRASTSSGVSDSYLRRPAKARHPP
jgi:hypothetical protein